MNNLQKIRMSRGLNQQELSRLTGIKTRTIGSWERNEHDLGQAAYSSVIRLAEVLGVAPEDFFERGDLDERT